MFIRIVLAVGLWCAVGIVAPAAESSAPANSPTATLRVATFDVDATPPQDAAIRAEPEGTVDPIVSLVSLWNGDKPVAVLSYYATHPQSYYRTGFPNPDFPGLARFFRQLAVPAALHVHFTGAGGNIGAGKYNDGSPENRQVLAERLADGMRRAWRLCERDDPLERDPRARGRWHRGAEFPNPTGKIAPAAYPRILQAPADGFTNGAQLWLDPSEVQDFAEVSVSGQRLGIVWKKPFRGLGLV